MPYIKQDERDKINPAIKQLAMDLKINGNKKGNLNYAITSLIIEHLDVVGIKYDTLSDISGVLHDVETEFDRRVIAFYENKKIKESGDLPFPKGE